MARKSITVSSVAAGVIAIIAGVVILFNWVPLSLVVGVFLIVWGVLALVNR